MADLPVLDPAKAGDLAVGSRWRFFVCARTGVRLSALGTRAKDRKLQFRVNKPDVFSFTIPSDSVECVQDVGDGYPLISKQRRVVKGYRRENGTWTIRFAGIIWQVEDTGEEEAFSSVTVYSPYVMLQKMPALPQNTPVGTVFNLQFDGLDIGKFIVQLVDNANKQAGF